MDHTGKDPVDHTKYVIYFLTQYRQVHLSPCDMLFYPTGGSGNFVYTLATGPQETKVARLVSPVVSSPTSDLCVSFWYHMFGSHIGTLHIKQRKQTVDGPVDILLWTVSGHQGNRWREGRVLVPRNNKPYQVRLNKSLFQSIMQLDINQHTSTLSVIRFKKALPINPCTLFKVVIESLVDEKSWGDIAVDDIKVLNGIIMMDCKGKAFSFHNSNACIVFMI